MKRILLLSLLVWAAPSFAQSQLACRDLKDSGGFLYSGETVVNGQACRQITYAPAPQAALVNTSVPAADPRPTAAAPASVVSVPAQPVATPVATPAPVIPSGPVSMAVAPGSRVYIAPMGGFETYLAAAFQKKHVQVVPVASEEQSQYVLSGTSEEKKAGWAKMAFMGSYHSDDAASVSMVDRKTGAIVFAYAVNKKNTMHGNQTTAEACAKHLQAHIEGKE